MLGADEFLDFFPRTFKSISGSLAQGVDPPMDIGVILTVDIGQSVDDRVGFLSRGGVVEIDQRVPVDLLFQNGEIPDRFIQVKMRLGKAAHDGVLPDADWVKRCPSSS